MNLIRNILLWLSLGALAGGVLGGIFAQQYWTFMATPAIDKALCDCEKVARGTASQILHYELVGLIVGAAIGVVVGIVVTVMLKRRRQRQTPAAPSPMPG